MVNAARTIAVVYTLLAATVLPIFEMPEPAVDTYLADLGVREPCFGARLIEVAVRSVGTSYAEGPLGQGSAGRYDKDPLIDLTRVDCVTFVEQTIALAASCSYEDALDTLRRIRYRNGEVSFESRHHFMISDWIANNRFCRDMTSDLGVLTGTVSRTISRKNFFKRVGAPDLAGGTPDRTIRLVYIPSAAVREAEKNLPSPALIIFVGKVDWLFALHCGFYVRDRDGGGLLYHASSQAGRVDATDFVEYLEHSSRYLGFTAYEIREPQD
jgi:D-alanyl-D-alanine carboxypeptidase/D-alanyl-D-alanine-endopeptidase (penicillin-binding protein 4)